MNKLKDIISQSISELKEISLSNREAAVETELLVEYITGYSKKDVLVNDNLTISDEQLQKFNKLLKERTENKKPVQYLVHSACFMGNEFYINENVLIPRPETELLVEEVISLANSIDKEIIKIIDIGTGSGCIPVSLALNIRNTEIFACDISQEALNIAELNAKKYNILNQVTFVHSDLLEDVKETFDIIVSNPPYIPSSEKENIQDEVLLHEPHSALFTEDQKGIEFYQRITEQSQSKLNKGGYLAFEMGISQSQLIRQILENLGFTDIRILKDYSGIDRIITGKKAG